MNILPTTAVGYVKLPDGSIIATTSGGIDTTSSEAGAVIYYVPKNCTNVAISESSVFGDLKTNYKNSVSLASSSIDSLTVPFAKTVSVSDSSIKSLNALSALAIQASYCLNLISLNVPLATTINVGSSATTKLYAPNALNVNSVEGALTAQSIGDILYQAYIDDRQDVSFLFSNGTNATESQVESYMEANYPGFNYASIDTWLTASSGTLVLNT